jgi:crotonobetainyl-CoA:carnitine CoA-transferase CaiB-like acyl-CoA transferase
VGTFFAELGAEVLKIESPGAGDVTRSWKLPSEDPNENVSAYFSSVNYKKKYLTLNLNTPEDHSILMQHIAGTDLLISNFKKGDAKKLNIEDATFRKINPRLIIGKISGFGVQSDRIAYDLILQAETGFMSINGEANQGPLKMPVALIDVLAAHHLKEGLLLALLSKEARTVNVSLYDAAVSSLMNQASNYLMTHEKPIRQGNLHPNIAPYGEVFLTKDGHNITFAVGSDKHFQSLCTVLESKKLMQSEVYKTNQLRVKNRIVLAEELSTPISEISMEVLLSDCLKNGIPCAEIKSIDQVLNNDLSKGLIREEIIQGKQTSRITSIAAKWE